VRTKPLILLILIVVLPLGGLTWLGLRVARDDEAALQRRFEDVFAVQLRDIDGGISRHFESLSIELRGTARQISFDPDDIRAVIRRTPQVRQVIVLDRDGLVLHPDPASALSLSERQFLNEAQELIQDRDLIHASSGQFDASTQRPITPGELSRCGQRVSSTVGSSSPDEGWHSWYWGRGVHLIFWQRRGTACRTRPLDGRSGRCLAGHRQSAARRSVHCDDFAISIDRFDGPVNVRVGRVRAS
jgi:hypothetical protein